MPCLGQVFVQVIISQVVVIRVVGGRWTSYRSIEWIRMTNGVQRPSYGPLWLLSAYKLSDITAGKLSVKSQFIAHNSKKAMVSEWHQSSTHGFHRVKKKLQQKSWPAILQGNTECRVKVYWTSSPFLVKS